MAERRVTLVDIAQVAGVSVSTVSRALGDHPRISEATRDLVVHAAEQLQYVPNQAARSLVMRATRTFGLLIPDVTDPLYGQVIAGFEQEAAAGGYTLTVANGFADPARERRALRLFTAQRADGIALMSSVLDQQHVVDYVRPTPVVFINGENLRLAGYDSDLPNGCIRADDVSGIDAVVEHLLAGGHRRIGYFNGPQVASNISRRDAIIRALKRAGVRERLQQFSAAPHGWHAAAEIAARVVQDLPDALICFDDKLALAMMDALRAFGVRVPDDIALVGFDDIPFAALSNPRLTTVAQPSDEMGRRAVGMLVQALVTGQPLAPSTALPVRFVVRESSAPRPAVDSDLLATASHAAATGAYA